ncbi:hypothetical protein [Burkholderia ambifaria]|uniref:hypothetical protein n=1 Tax=Burkholderia ambifaria TaxID=152480 RepID=UPI00158DD665|nr:hypothetical protein [Burkholderia ambifaria]
MQIETFIVICNRVFPLLKPESYSGSGISDRKKYSPDSQTFGYLTRLIKRAIFASTPVQERKMRAAGRRWSDGATRG